MAQQALEEANPQMVRAAGQVLSIALDKYLLLTGEATSRSEAVRVDIAPEELRAKAARFRDEILARQAPRLDKA